MFVSRKKFTALQKENKQLRTIAQQLALRIVDLENNVEFVTNNLSAEKKELVFGPENQN